MDGADLQLRQCECPLAGNSPVKLFAAGVRGNGVTAETMLHGELWS